MVEVRSLHIPDVKVIRPQKFGDSRGYFSEVYSKQHFGNAGIVDNFIQDNESVSESVHTLRGLHFQSPPFAQAKLIRVLRGAVLDVAVDLRRGSPSYGHHVTYTLTEDGFEQLMIPEGFAHGFLTLEPNTKVYYKTSAFYSRACDLGIRWNDPALAIDWGIAPDGVVTSERDRSLPFLSEIESPFVFETG